jgi:lysophospholipid acyltransferase (LPLAT)-like uncharacterized protein
MKTSETSAAFDLSASPVRRTSTPVVPRQPGGLQTAAARMVFLVERLLSASVRFRWRDHSGLFESAQSPPVIFCIWHNRLALSMVVHRRYPRKLAALISASKDGAFLAAILLQYGVLAVRGSTSRRGPQALLELTSHTRLGYDVAITPDGPRGPRYVVQEGIVSLAQLTGLPIVPVTCHTQGKICLKSWDRFQIPLPFARCDMVFHQPILVPGGISVADKETLRAALQTRMLTGSEEE